MQQSEMSMRDFRDRAGQRVDAAHFGGEATIVVKNGERRAVLVPYDWYEQRKDDATEENK